MAPPSAGERQRLRAIGTTLLLAGGLFLSIALIALLASLGAAPQDPRLATYVASRPTQLAVALGGVGGLLIGGGLLAHMLSNQPPVPTDPLVVIQVRCRSCHTLNDEQAQFCDHCGSPL